VNVIRHRSGMSGATSERSDIAPGSAKWSDTTYAMPRPTRSISHVIRLWHATHHNPSSVKLSPARTL
jgi:hypothetical protein